MLCTATCSQSHCSISLSHYLTRIVGPELHSLLKCAPGLVLWRTIQCCLLNPTFGTHNCPSWDGPLCFMFWRYSFSRTIWPKQKWDQVFPGRFRGQLVSWPPLGPWLSAACTLGVPDVEIWLSSKNKLVIHISVEIVAMGILVPHSTLVPVSNEPCPEPWGSNWPLWRSTSQHKTSLTYCDGVNRVDQLNNDSGQDGAH